MSPGKGSYFTSYRTYPFPYISPGVFAHAPDFGRMVALIRNEKGTARQRTSERNFRYTFPVYSPLVEQA